MTVAAAPIVIAHSPDSDDAFMHYALAAGKLDTGERTYSHVLQDIESLNQAAFEGKYPVTAISIHAYAHLHERYALLSSGASMGDGYGPRLITKRYWDQAEFFKQSPVVAIPGELTSANLVLHLWFPRVKTIAMDFDAILPAVANGEVEAGVLIHEGQLTYKQAGTKLLVDFGVWWAEQTGGLPLPLGGNAIRRDLGPERMRTIAADLKAAIAYALEHRDEALGYAYAFGRDLTPAQADEFVGMYVNQLTLDYGERGRRAVQLFLDRAHEAGLIPERIAVDFVG